MRAPFSQPHAFHLPLAAAALAAVVHAGSVDALAVDWELVYDTTQSLPGVTGSSSLPGGTENAPAYDGRYVVFQTIQPAPPNESYLWAYDSSNGRIRRLVDSTKNYPGTGTPMASVLDFFGGGFTPFAVDEGTVVFGARASLQEGLIAGFLATEPGGGIRILVDSETPIPNDDVPGGLLGRSQFTFAYNAPVFVDGGDLAFNVNVNDAVGGLGEGGYLVSTLGGADAAEIVTDVFFGSSFPPQCCTAADFHDGTTVNDTFNVFGTGPIVTATPGGVLETVVSAERGDQVPADPEERVFDNFTLVGPQIDRGNVLFAGAALPLPGSLYHDLAGLYSFIADPDMPRADPDDPLPPYAPGELRRLVDTATEVPGGSGNFVTTNSFDGTFNPPRTLGGEHVFFVARDEAGIEGLYHVPVGGGGVSKIIAFGDTLPDGRIVSASSMSISSQPAIQIDSADDDGVAVRLTVFDEDLGFAFDAIYLVRIGDLGDCDRDGDGDADTRDLILAWRDGDLLSYLLQCR